MDAAAEHLKRINLFDDKYFAEVFDAKTWDDGAGAYELERKMRVRRNAEFMKSLGLGDGVKLAAPKPFAARAPRKKAPKDEEGGAAEGADAEGFDDGQDFAPQAAAAAAPKGKGKAKRKREGQYDSEDDFDPKGFN